MRFKDFMNEASKTSRLGYLKKMLGEPTGNGISKDEYIWKFSDGSYLKIDDSTSRMGYFDEKARLLSDTLDIIEFMISDRKLKVTPKGN